MAAQLFPWKPTSITNTPQSVKDVNSSHSSYGEEGTPVPLPWKESQASSIRLPTNHLPVTRVSSADSCPFSQRASSSSSSASAYLPFSQPSLFHEVALQCTMTTSPTAVPIAQIAEALSPLPPPADAAMVTREQKQKREAREGEVIRLCETEEFFLMLFPMKGD